MSVHCNRQKVKVALYGFYDKLHINVQKLKHSTVMEGVSSVNGVGIFRKVFAVSRLNTDRICFIKLEREKREACDGTTIYSCYNLSDSRNTTLYVPING